MGENGPSNRVGIVTGAATGLGAQYARRLAADGFTVVLADLDPADETVASIEADGGDAWAAQCDVTDEQSVTAFCERVTERHGRCDALVNNAGIYPLRPLAETSLADLRRVIAVNLEGSFLMSRAVVPLMQANGWGRIVNISSTTAWLTVPDFGAYIASKMAVIGLTRAYATELGESGITVNCACPSLVRTGTTEAGPQAEMFDEVSSVQAIKRTQLPEDMAGLISFLCSEDSAFMTGQTLICDGGLVRL